MKNSQHDLLVIYFKQKDGVALTKEEQRVWEEYHKEQERGEVAFDEKALAELVHYQQPTLCWEQFRDKHNISWPMAAARQKQQAIDQVRSLQPGFRYLIAASLLLVIASAWWFTLHNPAPDKAATAVASVITPGYARAILQLADGRTIALDTIKQGLLVQLGNISVYHHAPGLLQFQYSHGQGQQPSGWNSLHIPRGKEYQLILADGTNVWLNAATVFRFPTAFGNGERGVELEEGEAYFDVAKKSAAQPFIVLHKEQKIQVLGTQFNIKAYAEEAAVTTTLVEGSVNVTNGWQSWALKPGQQVILNKQGNFRLSAADLKEVTAWKDKHFRFSDQPFSAIMAEVQRWYDVEVIYLDPLPDERFMVGAIPRSIPLEQLLELFEAIRFVRFRVEGRKVYISRYR